jgi:hypothetical protein
MSLLFDKSVFLASHGHVQEGVDLMNTRVRPLYVTLLNQKVPGFSKENLANNDAMVKVWKSWLPVPPQQ